MSTIDPTVNPQRDVYATVTAQIINAIEQGVGSWRMPWHTSGKYAFSPISIGSGKPYRGINTVCLWAAAQARGYERGEWGTYKQWQDIGGQVRKGEKSTTVVFWKFASDATENQDGENGSRLLFTRGYAVFNARQVDNCKLRKNRDDRPLLEKIEQAEAFFADIGANVRHGGNQAFYRPSDDYIQMPPFQAFKENLGYYSTLAHETTHWTAKSESL